MSVYHPFYLQFLCLNLNSFIETLSAVIEQATEAEITTSKKCSFLIKKVINQSGLLSYCIYLFTLPMLCQAKHQVLTCPIKRGKGYIM